MAQNLLMHWTSVKMHTNCPLPLLTLLHISALE